MKSYLLFVFLLSLSLIGFSQSKKELQAQVMSLSSEKQKLIDENQKLLNERLSLKEQILDLKTDNLNFKSENEKLRLAASSSNNVVPASNTSIVTPVGQTQKSTGRCQAITAKGTQCTRNAEPGSNYCWQHKSTYEPGSAVNSGSSNSKVSPNTNSGSSSYGGRTIYTGPRGGKYYINKNGNKTYIKR